MTYHEAWDDAMENATLVAIALGVKSQMLEIVGGLLDVLAEKAEDHAASRGSADRHIEKYLVGNLLRGSHSDKRDE